MLSFHIDDLTQNLLFLLDFSFKLEVSKIDPQCNVAGNARRQCAVHCLLDNGENLGVEFSYCKKKSHFL